MNDRAVKPQILAVCLFAIVGVFVGVRAIRSSGSRSTSFATSTTKIQVDLITEEAASQGKIIEARDKGVVTIRYVCTEKDAAVAMVTARDMQTGTDVFPLVIEAKDQDRKSYSVDVKPGSPASLLVLRNGFAKKPKFVDIWIMAMGRPSSPVKIHLTKFGEPVKLIRPPSQLDARKVEQKANAVLNDTDGFINVTYNASLLPNEIVVPKVLATTFESGRGGDTISPYVDETSRRETDAVKVRLDHFRVKSSITTLTYTNAKIQSISGRTILAFPFDQQVGSLLGFPVQLKDLHARIAPKIPGKTTPPQEIYLEVSTAHTSSDPPINQGVESKIRLVGVSPPLESLGIDALRVKLYASSNKIGSTGEAGINAGFDQTLHASGSPVSNPPSELRELQFKVMIDLPTKVFSETLVLPVQHINRPGPNSAGRGTPVFGVIQSRS